MVDGNTSCAMNERVKDMTWEVTLKTDGKETVYEYEHNNTNMQSLINRVFTTLEGEIIKIELMGEAKPVKKRLYRGREVSKTKRLAFVKEHFKMTPHDVLVIAHHVLGYDVIMVSQLDDMQWEEVIKQAEDFQKDGVLASYLGHK